MRILPLLLLLTVHSAWSKADQKSQVVSSQPSKGSLEDNIVGKVFTLEVKGEAVHQMMFHANGVMLLGKNNNLRDKGVTYQIDNKKVLIFENGKKNGGMSFFSSSPKVGDHVEVGAEDDKQKVKIFKIEPYIGGIHKEDVEVRERIAYFGGSPYTGKVFMLYENGKNEGESHFKNGKLNGSVRRWYENGKKKFEANWKDGKADGLFTDWYKNGQKKGEVIWKDGKIDELQNGWYDNGQKRHERTFKDGKPYGLHLTWHENGKKKKEVNFKDGLKNGLAIGWYDNGQKESEINFKDGVEISVKYWSSKGVEGVNANELEQRESIYYLKGSNTPYTGKVFLFHESYGHKLGEGNYKDGKPDGLTVIWHDDGQKRAEVNFKDGEMVSEKFWNSKGEPVDSQKEAY
jgi:antitoxin component YwqK of YwqJK toxin-antitoxin module